MRHPCLRYCRSSLLPGVSFPALSTSVLPAAGRYGGCALPRGHGPGPVRERLNAITGPPTRTASQEGAGRPGHQKRQVKGQTLLHLLPLQAQTLPCAVPDAAASLCCAKVPGARFTAVLPFRPAAIQKMQGTQETARLRQTDPALQEKHREETPLRGPVPCRPGGPAVRLL